MIKFRTTANSFSFGFFWSSYNYEEKYYIGIVIGCLLIEFNWINKDKK